MTRSEYQELVEFIGPKFDRIERRFGAIEGRLTRVEVLEEQNRHLIQIVAESVANVDQKLDRFQVHVSDEFRSMHDELAVGLGAVRCEMASGFSEVRREMDDGFKAHAELIEGLDARVGCSKGRSA